MRRRSDSSGEEEEEGEEKIERVVFWFWDLWDEAAEGRVFGRGCVTVGSNDVSRMWLALLCLGWDN